MLRVVCFETILILCCMIILYSHLLLQFDDGMDWWIEILRYAAKYGMDDIVIQKVKDDLEENTEEEVQSMSHKLVNWIFGVIAYYTDFETDTYSRG